MAQQSKAANDVLQVALDKAIAEDEAQKMKEEAAACKAAKKKGKKKKK